MPYPNSTHVPTSIGSTQFAVRYAMSYFDVNYLLNEISDTSFTNAVSKLFTDPIENIISLVYYPIDMTKLFGSSYTVGRGPVVISKCTLTTEGSYLPIDVPAMLSLGQITLGRYFNNFLDFAPYTKVEIYLPFIGFETLDTDLVMGKTIKIQYAVDTYTGKCTAYVILVRSGSETVILTRDGQCGQQIQVAGGSGADIARNLLKFGASTIMGAANTAGFIGGAPIASGVKTAAGFLASATVGAMDAARYNVHKGGLQETLTAFYAPTIAYLIVTRPVVAEPSSYAHSYGRPCGKTLTLSACSGFTQVDAVHIEGSGFATATIGERDEIERLLKTGVIL